MIYLTDVGKRYAEKYATSGATYLITAQLNEKSPQTVTEIARETSMDIDELKKRIEELAKEGVVRIGGGEG
jgi:DNA-binding MarR family transcriptional regulator